MSLFRWKPEYAVGIKVIDDQHQILISLINKLHDAIESQFESASLESILEELFDYTRYHFTTEETLMAQYGYTEEKLTKHKKQHQLFIAELNSSQADIDKLTIEDAALIQEFLVNWLKNHILKVDTKLAEFLLNHDCIHDQQVEPYQVSDEDNASANQHQQIKEDAKKAASELSNQIHQLDPFKMTEAEVDQLKDLADQLTHLLEQL
ncbi:bacteriohemerythrin [Litoribrevibacter albus]|uniref:Hemerythrin-like domain-containing protein n=1 Tax=Litoribrevibacter albus TaxID=1473156 RepID=A0AA37S7D5_9GAMM|nr:bacteriohemerythrin [Litoribrevibacter albus]GLQ29731.1 hypothetical protein GCM10007876_02090 [Litoribrevibacter albus]